MKPKQRLGSLGIGLLALAMASAQVAKLYDVEASRSYSLPDGSTVSYEGGCSFDDKQVNCWTPDGTPAPDLSEKISSYYLGSNGNELTIGFKKKNRLVVFSRSSGSGGVSINSLEGSYLQVHQLNGNGNGFFGWAMVKSALDAKSVSLVLTPYGLPAAPLVRAPFTEGAKLSYDGASITLGGTKSIPKDRKNAPGPGQFTGGNGQQLGDGKCWQYFVAVETPNSGQLSLGYTMIDKDGKSIRYVDRNGRAVSELKYVKESPYAANGYYMNPSAQPNAKYVGAYASPNYVSGSVVTITSNIDPAEVKFLEVSGSRSTRILFRDIPLDPK